MEGRTGLDGRPALERLIAVSPNRFAEEYWSRSPLLTRRGELERGFEDLFSLEAADEILSTRGLRTPFIRVAKDGAIVDASRFTGPGGVGAAIADQVVDERILDLFASGHTLVLQALHRLWPPLVAFSGRLGAELGHPVQVNAYITPNESQGFAAHYDVHDVFVLQIAGKKRWIIHDPVHPDPLRNQPWTQHRAAVESRAKEVVGDESVLEGGDVLYLPRGFIHSAEALGGVSVHLTIGVHNQTRQDLVQALLELAADDPRLRSSLAMGVDVADSDQLARELTVTVEALIERIRSIAATDVARVMGRRDRRGSRPAPLAPLAQAHALATLSPETVVGIRPLQKATLSTRSGQVTVDYAGGTLTFSPRETDALRSLLEGPTPVRLDDIPGLDEAQRLEIVGRLMRAGIVVADPPAHGR